MQSLEEKYNYLFSCIDLILPPCLHLLSMSSLLEQLAAERNSDFIDLEQAIDHNVPHLKGGLLVEDLSGIGLYTLAFLIAKKWSEGKVLKKYKNVIVIPIEQISKLPCIPGDLNGFLNSWSIQAKNQINFDNTLLIYSGCSLSLRKYSGSDKNANQIEQTIRDAWINLQKNYDHIVITTADTLAYFPNIQRKLKISLKPLHLKIDHPRCSYVIKGEAIINEARNAIEQVFFHEKQQNLIKNAKDFHKQVELYMRGEGPAYQQSSITVKHIFPLFTSAALIRALLGQPHMSDNQQAFAKKLCTTEEWFCAAVTANPNNGEYFSYQIADRLIVRKKENSYLADLGPLDAVPGQILKTLASNPAVDFLRDILKELINIPNFDKQTAQQLQRNISEIKRRQNKNLDKKVFKNFRDLCGLLDSPDETLLSELGAEYNHRASYQEIQKKVNDEIKLLSLKNNIASITQEVRKILSGYSNGNCEALTLGISCIALAETSRYPEVFLATLCLLDLIELNPQHERSLWNRFFFMSDNNQNSNNDFDRTLLLDITQTLGGLHPMSQANSYHQATQRNGHRLGLNWVEFKSHLIYLKWLTESIAKEKDISPHLSALIIDTIPEESKIVTDLILGFKKVGVTIAIPYIFDRFSRCLATFDFSLNARRAIRELMPNSLPQLRDFFKTSTYQLSLRMGLPKEVMDISPDLTDRALVMRTVLDRLQYAIHLHLVVKDYELSVSEFFIILAIDPLFYHVYYFIANIYYSDLKNIQLAYENINKFIQAANPNSGDWYYTALYLRIKCLYGLNLHDQLPDLFEMYFNNYHDITDQDYWRTMAFRGLTHYELTNDLSSCLYYFNEFRKNVPEDGSYEHHAINEIFKTHSIPTVSQPQHNPLRGITNSPDQILFKYKERNESNIPNKNQALVRAAKAGNEKDVLTFLSQGADINSQDENLKTALHWAVSRIDDSLINCLLAAHASYNIVDNDGKCAFDDHPDLKEYYLADEGFTCRLV